MTSDAGPAAPAQAPPPPDRPRRPRQIRDRPGGLDRIFTAMTTSAGLLVLGLLALIGFFLLLRAQPALQQAGWRFFTTVEFTTSGVEPVFGVLGLAFGTVVVAVIALSVAVPVSVLCALFITDYTRPRLRSSLTGLVDLLAAVPSLLYGLWGFAFLNPQLSQLSGWLTANLGWFPLFRTGDNALLQSSFFIAGLVVSLMILPIITSVMREVLSQAPPSEKEAALALGGTRWGMVRAVVLPFGRGGIIGASMLGLGRALGETIAVALLLPQIPVITLRILENEGSTIAGYIARNVGAGALTSSALLAAGLVLFAFTLLTNLGASVVISRSRSGAGVDA